MKKRTVLRSVAALTLTIVMLLATALPALAASGGNGSITINPNGQGKLGGADRFTAYQIFSGTVGTNPNELDGLDWASGVNHETLVANMKSSTLSLEGSTFGDVFGDAWDDWKAQYENQMSEAEFVAQWLGQHLNNDDYADDFARLVAGCVTPGGGTKSSFNSDSTAWVIENLDPGYYLVVDGYQSGTEAPDGSVSSYILQVLGKETVTLKATIPTVEKKIVSGSGPVDGILTETETPVTFTLTGTVAENIGEYETYSYKFTDTISKGLTVTNAQQNALTVTYTNGSTTRQFTRNDDYTVTYENGSDGGHVLTVTFSNLKQSLKNRVQGIDLSNTTLVKGINIVVTYQAQLNENAVIGEDGNPNDVVLEYSNNPYSTGKGETVHDEVKTYTLALRIVKQDVDHQPLDGVVFKLMKGQNSDPNAGSNQFATFKQGTGEAGIAPGQQETYQEISGWATGINNGGTLTTDGNGEFNIHGLSAGTYTLVETKAPEGYETMKPIVFTITGTVDATGALTGATLSTNEDTRQDVQFSNTSLLAHNGQLTLTNFKSPILPHTGGMGAKVVYLVSGLTVLVGVTIVVMAMRKRTRGRHEQSR